MCRPSSRSGRVVVRSVACRHCGAACLVALCIDGRWRIFDRSFHIDREMPMEMRWWLTRGLGMVHGGVAEACPDRWVSLHYCHGEAGLSGVAAIGDLVGSVAGGRA